MARGRTHAAVDGARVWARFAQDAAPELAAFQASLDAPEAAQQRILLQILARNADTEYGRRYGFASIRSYETFRRRVPVTRWPDVAPWIERSQAALAPVVCAETPSFYERTSGSSAALKHIPYTPTLMRELQRALVVWLAKLYEECPRVAGPSYWALSPAAAPVQRAPNGVPVGSASDAQYLGSSAAAQLLPTVLDMRSAVQDRKDWRLATLHRLVAAQDLRLISVWSPTFLSALLDPLLDEPRRAAVHAWLDARLRPERRRALGHALRDGHFGRLWPALQVISCWMDGPSASYAGPLARLFPQARLVPKGLFATEGVVSIPWGVSGSCPLAIESHVLEFEDDSGSIRPAHALVEGERYRPLLTTSGGLYRYALGDTVLVDRYLGRTPCIRYLGRGDARTDLTGEKLDEPLVAQALDGLTSGYPAACLVPMADVWPLRYMLLLEAPAGARAPDPAADIDRAPARVAASVEQRLMSVFHYAHARRNGQLAALTVRVAPNATALMQQAWEETLGRRAGDFKPAPLVSSPAYARAIVRTLDGGPAR